jgi:hypothetical protein
LEQSDMCPVLNMAKIAKGGFWPAAIEETQFPIKNLTLSSKRSRSGVLHFVGITSRRLQ